MRSAAIYVLGNFCRISVYLACFDASPLRKYTTETIPDYRRCPSCGPTTIMLNRQERSDSTNHPFSSLLIKFMLSRYNPGHHKQSNSRQLSRRICTLTTRPWDHNQWRQLLDGYQDTKKYTVRIDDQDMGRALAPDLTMRCSCSAKQLCLIRQLVLEALSR